MLKRRENYDDWVFEVENLLVLEGAEKCLKQKTTGAVRTVVNRGGRCKSKSKIKKHAYTMTKLWTTVKSLFEDSGFSRRITLLGHLISIRLENCKRMTNYVTQIVETAQRLTGTGFEINDDKMLPILRALKTWCVAPNGLRRQSSRNTICGSNQGTALCFFSLFSIFTGEVRLIQRLLTANRNLSR